MIEIPRRQSLTVQTLAALRKGIEERAWTDRLPGERRLCELFQISRPTLRRALHLLSKEGLVAVEQGKRSRILHAARRARPAPSQLVGLITTEPIAHFPQASFHGIAEMRQHLLQNGFTSEVVVCQARDARAQIRQVQNFLRQNAVFCCVLVSVGRELQQWFAKEGIPALVLGSCHSSVRLPSLDVDYRAVCRHAAGHLLAHGHRRIALVVPDSNAAGDLASEEGFCAAMKGAEDAGALPSVVRHNGTARGITSRLDALFNSAHPPTALLVAKPLHVFIVIIYLLKRGLAVPDTVSLIARDQDFPFEKVSPPITHYAFDDGMFAKRLTRLMLQLAGRGELAQEPNLIFPRLVKGGTVKMR